MTESELDKSVKCQAMDLTSRLSFPEGAGISSLPACQDRLCDPFIAVSTKASTLGVTWQRHELLPQLHYAPLLRVLSSGKQRVPRAVH
jgi:hypothetical protein